MKAVILAAGKGTRMRALSDTLPKPMLSVAGKTLLEHKFDILPEAVDEIVLVIGYLGNVIRERFGDAYKGKKITYVEQTDLNGTGGALLLAKEVLTDRFIVMMGDDIYSSEDVKKCMATSGWALLLLEMEHMRSGGKMVMNEKGEVIGIEEGDHQGKPGLFNTNMAVLDPRIFDFPMVPKAPGSSEFGLPHNMINASLSGGIPIQAVMSSFWIQITSPEDLKEAETTLASQR